jgi:UDP-N-acetylglucosamine 2-epimerase (hydrolysing)
MRFAYFSELMRRASAMVGNSSAGVREAPFFGVPSLAIGTRQNNRANGPSITACLATDSTIIDHFLQHTWALNFSPDMTFGDGNAADRFVEAIKLPNFWSLSLQKSFSND